MPKPADAWHFGRPALAQDYLEAFGLGLTSARGLFARRRMGKTQFLTHDLAPAARERKYLTAYTNLWENADHPGEAIATAIMQAVEPKGIERFWQDLNAPVKKVKGAGKLAGGLEGSLEVDLAEREKIAVPAIQAALQAADRKRKRLLLLIDEAQVLSERGSTSVARALRAGLDTRKASIKVLFTGSSEAALREMFSRATRPFYNWAPIDPFPLLDQAFVEAMVERVEKLARKPLQLALALEAFEALNRTPEYFRWYLERYVLYQGEGSAAALAHTQQRINDEAGYESLWSEMPLTDRAELMLLAQGVNDLLSLATLERLRMMLGDNKLSLNVSRVSVRRLSTGRHPVLARVDHGLYRFEDPEFGDWVALKQSLD